MVDYKPERFLLGLLVVFCLVQSFAFCSNILSFYTNDYLPSPFFYVKPDTFMDFFHLIYWSGDDGRYTDWSSVYPPLVFIIAGGVKAIFLGGTDFNNGFDVRDAGFFVGLLIMFSFISVPYLAIKTQSWRVFSQYEKLFLYLGFILSTPLLFALERGNVIIIALALLAMIMSQAGVYRCILIALLINIKPYFVLLTLLFLVKNKRSDFLFCIGSAGFIFLITGLLLDNNFLLFFENILSFSEAEISSLREVIALPSSVSAYAAVLDSQFFYDSEFLLFLPSPEALASLIELTKWSIIAMVLFLLVTATKKNSEAQVMAVLVVLISNLGTSVGGYTFILYFTLIPVFWLMHFRWAYLCILGLIFSSVNIYPLVADMSLGSQYSYLSGTFVSAKWVLDAGSAIKPMLNMFLLLLLSYELAFKKNNEDFKSQVF
jgi:hypothetical protein